MSAADPDLAAIIGMAWWNRITDAERRRWMLRAGDTGIAADAYTVFLEESGAGAPGAPCAPNGGRYDKTRPPPPAAVGARPSAGSDARRRLGARASQTLP